LRIGQEAIFNAVKHSRGSKITVIASLTDGVVRLSVNDNGRGFDADSLDQREHGHWGLIGMRERARGLGAELEISSVPGRGAQVVVTCSLQSAKGVRCDM
jgi:signal transduction histidine kinase